MYHRNSSDPVRTVIALIIGFCFIVAVIKIDSFLDWIDSHFYTFLWGACVLVVAVYWYFFGANNSDEPPLPPTDYQG